MSVELEDNAQAPPTNGLEAVGKRLAGTRQKQQLEVAAVATELHLRIEVIEALEAGDESGLPAMTFVRGYIKAYARLLGLDEQDVLAALPSSENYRAQPLKAVGMRRKQSLRLPLPLGKGIVWLLVIALLLALILYGLPLAERLMDKLNQSAEAVDSTLSLPLDAPTLLLDELSAPVFTSSPKTIASPEVKAPDEALQEQEKIVPLESISPTAEVTESEAAIVAEEPVTGPAEISMRFKEDSWVEMESHGRKLVVGTQRAGTRRTIQAEPPIQILLGNAPGVEISYRGESVDLRSYQRGKVARLLLED
ncbi:hypothetical protein MNBD_GAMMA13-723 [hydrothermal vent metagenome]|uniref:Cytoskeleton protein RodZ-like C-terminal domain-containing protein n=1 Tax=hydrothermal vent metagenome TaxID=652676 RepID=A0A3B0Y7Q7_9ZZZZ